MVEFNEIKIKRILNPTAINLGECVINPFMGCEFSCLYCYVRSNRVISRKKAKWGEYVDIRVNAPELLEREIIFKKPKTVLLGSTTECFQPIEKRYHVTKDILEILNKHKINYCILTRSPFILDYISLLKEGFCKRIYFTINKFSPEFKAKLEPKSPAFDLRDEAVNRLLEENVPVVPYFSPLLPWISDLKDVFLKFERAEAVEFECFNFNLKNIDEIIKNIGEVNPALKLRYEKMRDNKIFYRNIWQGIDFDISRQAKRTGKSYDIYIHPAPKFWCGVHNFGDYFNRYTQPYKEESTYPSRNKGE